MNTAKYLVQPESLTPIDITFKNIIYQVNVQPDTSLPISQQVGKKTILNNVSGIFKAGQLTAIMGSSGAGKTTLLNILAGRIAEFQGDLYANNQPYSFQTFGNFANYVMQSDILMQTLTVRETLQFAANLKISDDTLVQKRLTTLTKKLKLQKCLDVLVGGPILKGISGGQKKRTSIAFELISDPQVIALDEPTSGLDSLTSFIILNELKQLSQAGKTVFLTIHQPATQIYNLFDRLILMVEGNIIYQSKSSDVLTYFEKNFNLICPAIRNPAQYVIEITHLHDPLNVERIPKYNQKYLEIQSGIVKQQIKQCETNTIVSRIQQVTYGRMLRTLINRDLVNLLRNPMILKARIYQTIFIALLIGGVWWKIGQADYTNLIYWNAITGCLFFACIDIFFQAAMPVALVFPLQRLVFLKQQNSKMYNVVPYFLSRNIIEIPYLIICPALYILVAYWMIGLSGTAQQFFVYYFILFLLCFAGSSVGLLFGSMIHDAKSVSTVIPIVVIPLIIFSGFFKNSGSISKWTKFLEYTSPFKYAFMASVYNQTKYKPSLVNVMNYDFDQWPAIGMLIMLGVVFRLLSLYFLWFRKGRVQ